MQKIDPDYFAVIVLSGAFAMLMLSVAVYIFSWAMVVS